MATRQELGLDQQLRLTLTPQQLRFVKLLELNTPELEDVVAKELEANVALSEKDPESERDEEYDRSRPYIPSKSGSPDSDAPVFTPADTEESIYDNLRLQLSEKTLAPEIEEIALFIIGSLDSNGYLDRPLASIINDMEVNEGIPVSDADAREALEIVRSLDPPGIGAFNLKDALELQLLRTVSSPARDNALRIIREAFEAFTMKHKHRIISLLGIISEEADEALGLIRSLNPRPGASLGHSALDEAAVIVPDFVVNVEDGDISISLNNRIPELQIDESFRQAVDSMERSAKGRLRKGSEFITRNYNDARDFISVLAQRQKTMMDVMTAIVKIQKDYFLTRDVYRLKPMMIKNVAELTGLDFSVISRATNSKYVSTPWGVFPLRFFFSDSVGDTSDGSEALTNRKIEEEIRSLVESEDKLHPLSDQKLMEEISARGYEISRRTVAKYRDRLKIPVARLRKEL